MLKVKLVFVCLEDDVLTKAVQLPKSISKIMCFFHRGNPESDGSVIYTNMRIMHAEDMQTIIGNLHYVLEEKEITAGCKECTIAM